MPIEDTEGELILTGDICEGAHLDVGMLFLLALPLHLQRLSTAAGGRADIGNLASHLTNTCHLKRQAVQQKDTSSCGKLYEEEEEAAVKLLSELPQVMRATPQALATPLSKGLTHACEPQTNTMLGGTGAGRRRYGR